jgi:hypothetical protein
MRLDWRSDMKHKHYDMIVAKAENVDLVVLVRVVDN